MWMKTEVQLNIRLRAARVSEEETARQKTSEDIGDNDKEILKNPASEPREEKCLLSRFHGGEIGQSIDHARPAEDTQKDTLAADIQTRSDVLNSLFRPARAPRPASQVPKRAQQGSRFALSLDVPTSILSVLMDLAKNQDMRTKAAANAELMARIGKRK
ncbi:hypothetical protein LDENG_00173270 [Lucifuga dentata]|nr:hypothetical protein LDENG_00173270 [Lucifuga dentata]